jgi:hypothetical protein
MNKNESGFSGVELVLVLVIVVLIGVVGWLVYDNHHKSTVASTNSSTSTSAKTPNATPSSTQKYLTITEWGTRIPYSGNDTLSYKLNTADSNDATIISKNLADTYNCTDFGAGNIARLAPDAIIDPGPATAAETAKTDPADYPYLNGYYYNFGHDQAACSDKAAGNTAGASAESAANDFTKSILAKIEAIPAP